MNEDVTPQYCQFCGSGGLEHDSRESAFTCRRCGRTTYLTSSPSACAVVVHDAKVLLVRSRGDQHNRWDFPGGFLLNGEPPEDGLKREMKEELNADVQVRGLLAALVDTYEQPGRYSLNLFYETSLESEGVTAAGEIAEYGWFALDDLPVLRFETTRKVLLDHARTV